MKTLVKGIALFAMMAGAGQASAYVINDTYYGADGFSGLSDRDVIGDSRYQIYNMDVNFDSTYMTVRVNTNFTNVGDPYKVDFGDLFISIDGWNPNTTLSNYRADNASTGEDWEFVFDTSGGMLHGGNFDIYTSDQFFGSSGLYYRKNQEVQYAGGGTNLGGSSVDLTHAGAGGYVEYKILLASLGISGDVSLGLKWGMTCANDTIEGKVDTNIVPEPASLLLIGIGLLGLGVLSRKRA